MLHDPAARRRLSRRTALLLGAALLPVAAMAQSPPAPPPEQEAAGTVSVDAGVEASIAYVDNIFATRNREEDDLLLLLRPYARFDLGSGRDRLTLRGSGEIGRFGDFGSEDYEDWLVALDGRKRLATDLSLTAGAEWRWEHESRASPDAVGGLEPTEYQRGFGYAGLVGTSGRFAGRLGGTATRYDFRDVPRDGGTINNDDRDRTQIEFGGRAGLRQRSGTELFVQGTYDLRDYDDRLDDSGFRRDSQGGSLVAGMRRDLGGGFSGELFAGWLHQDYDDPRLVDVDAFDLGALLDWTGPHGLGGSFRIDRTVEETTLPGASAYILTAGRLSLRAAPHPRLSAGFALTGSQYDYRGAGRTEFVLGADLWARYWLTRRLYAEASYVHAQRTSNAAGFDFDQNRFLVSLGARLRPQYRGAAAPLRLGGEAPAGAYAGLLAGYGALIAGLDGPRGQGGNTADFGDHGAAAVGVLGYGLLVDSLYLGVEAEASLVGPGWLHTSDRVFSMDKENAFGVAARIGGATRHGNLVYGRFGVSSGEFETRYANEDHAFGDDDRATGLGIGAGLEARAGRRGFIRAEYVLTSYPDRDVPAGEGDFDNFSASESQFRFGGGIRFGAAPPPGPAAAARAPVVFSGPYVGIQLGHGALVSDNRGTRNHGIVDILRASHGGLLGVYAGAGAVYGRAYIGAEVEGDVSAINWNIEREPTGRVYSAEHEYSYGAAARAGVLLGDSAMIYGRFGAVRTRFDIPYATTNRFVRSRETQTGLRFGGGLEIGLSGRARLRADYSITRYGDYLISYGLNVDRFDHSETLFRIGLGWRL